MTDAELPTVSIPHEPTVVVEEDGRLLVTVSLSGVPDDLWSGAFGAAGLKVPAVAALADVSSEHVSVRLRADVANSAVWTVLDWVVETIPRATAAWKGRGDARDNVAEQIRKWWLQKEG